LLSFFNKQYKRKRGAAATPTPMAAASTTPHDPVEHELQEILGGIETEMEAISRLIIDSGRVEHDETAVTGIREQAIREMSRRGVTYTPAQAASAIRVLPKHAALAVKTRDNGHVRDTFERLVLQYPADRRYGEYRTLSPRNATRWGSDYKLLQSYHALQTAVDKLLSLPLGLGNLRLSAEEANLTKNLRDMLAPVEEVTKAFQTDDVPLIMDVIPAYDQLQRDFCAMSNDTSLPSICRVAAHAAYLMTRKYYSRLDECEAYFFAIVLCPDRKLQWFYNHGWTQSDVAQILNMIKRRFLEKFKTSPSGSSESAPATEGVHRWRQSAVASAPSEATTYDLDSITHYLSLPPHPLPPGTTVLQYWNSQLDITPCLATMALAYTSAPGESPSASVEESVNLCDPLDIASTAPAEREFSEGRTMINWNQEGMSSQTFRAKMCVSAWSGAPWYNEEVAVQIITDTSRSLRTAPAS
ncbi:ribonuclease H-like domain-containing protein, partial [Cubamyces menziesii]